MPSKKTPQQQAENLSTLDTFLDEVANERANDLSDKLDALTLKKLLEKLSTNDGEVGPKSKAIISQLRMGMYTKIASENAEAEEATVSDEDIERMKQRAFNPGKVLRAIASTPSQDDDDDDTQMRLLMGGQ